jgi:hypothetical protein
VAANFTWFIQDPTPPNNQVLRDQAIPSCIVRNESHTNDCRKMALEDTFHLYLFR